MLWWILFFIVFNSAFGGHFDGGSIRWAPVNKNASASPVQIMITQTYTYTLSLVSCTIGSLMGTTIYGFNFSLWCSLNCGATSAGYVAPPVLGYCTGSSPGLNLAYGQRTDVVNLTANDYFSVSHSIPSTASQGYYRQLTLSSGGTDSTAQWNMTASIDIRPRTDNGLINTPPLANVISPYGIPYNVTTQIIIPTMDVDGDDIRCRWSNSTLECGDVCYPRTIPASTTLSNDCILTITGTSLTGWYCASIQVEDFLNTSTSLQPMSSTAVQFLIYVYKTKNCSIPTLSSPSTCVGVRVGIPYTLTLTAINSCGASSNISDIAIQAFSGIVQGPVVLITPNKTVYVRNITYTPVASQVGLQMLCATAVDNTNIPSSQYCVTFMVGTTVTPTCPGATSSTIQASTANDDITSIAAVTGSKSVQITSLENLLTSDITHMDSTNQISSISSTLSTSITTTTLKPNSINWLLIGSLVGVISLLALLCSCCFCYHYLWSAAARRRRRRQQEDKHKLRYEPVNKSVTNLRQISYPPKSYQVYDIERDRRKSSNSNNNINCQTRKSLVSIRRNTIHSEISEKPVIHVKSSKEEFHLNEIQRNSSIENRIKSTVSVTRILNTKQRKSMPIEKKSRQTIVTRIKK